MGRALLPIHHEILRILTDRQASYACPIPSVELASALNVAPSYVRHQVAVLRSLRMVGVRRGRGGGYYLPARPPGRTSRAPAQPAQRGRRSGAASRP